MSKKTDKNKPMSRKNRPGALDEFLERQDLAQNPANFMGGNYHSIAYVGSTGKVPIFRMLLGVIIGIAAVVLLISSLGEGNWFNLIFVALMAGLSALLIVSNIRSKKSKHKHRAKE